METDDTTKIDKNTRQMTAIDGEEVRSSGAAVENGVGHVHSRSSANGSVDEIFEGYKETYSSSSSASSQSGQPSPSCLSPASFSSSASAAVSDGSFDLNPNSTIMQDDLPGIALLKEIFPEESTENLRLLHHQHIFSHQLLRNQHGGDDGDENDVDVGDGEDSMQQHEYNEEPRIESDATDGKPPPIDSPLGGIRQRLDFHHDGEQHYALPEDFLRLPISIAILRPISRNVGDDSGNHNVQESIPDRTQYKYELLSDLQRKVMNEYSLCNHCIEEIDDIEGEDTEFLCFAIKKHRRWGLGMTLQEDENGRQKYANSKTTMRSSKSNKCSSQFDNDDRLVSPIPFGLTVVSFLPDADKIKNGEIKSDIPRSPAQEAGIHIDDVLIGVNGSAFLLPRFSSELYTSGSSYDEHYNRQKTQIIKSIQASPDPIVVHVRRKRPKSLPSYSCTKKGSDPSLFTSPSTSSIQRSASLLDSTSKDEIEVFALDDSRFKTPPIKQAYSGPSNASTRANLRSSSSHKDPLPLSAPPPTPPPSKQFTKHPLAYALVQRKLIRSGDDEWRITTRLQQFTERTRQWESSSALRLKVEISSALSTLLPYFDPKDLPPEMAALIVYSGQEDNTKDGRHVATDSLLNRLYTPSTPSLPHDSPLIPVEYLQAFYGEEQARQITLLRSDLQNRTGSMNSNKNVSPSEAYPALRLLSPNKWIGMTDKKGTADSNSLAWVPLHGIRKSISARIVNSFVEEAPGGENSFQNNPAPRMAYTIWVYDVESGNEWYAPIRFWKDFCDLRDAAMSLLPTTSNTYREISGIKFPREPQIQTNGLTWGPALGSAVFGSRYSKRLSPLSPLQQKRRQRQDEEFEDARLEICCTLEDFLRELLGIVYTCQPLQPCVAEIALYVQSFLGVDAGTLESPASTAVFNIEQAVVRKSDSGYKKQVRRALKHSIQRYTWRIFLLHSMKAIVRDFVDAARARGLRLQDVEVLESQGKSVLKSKAAEELGKIQSFLDSLVDLIIDGCQEDFEGIARRLEYAAVHDILNDQINWDRLIRDAVREQVEIEVYIPLRSVVSRLLVNGWRHEDMESNFKIKELRKRPQHLFRIPEKNISPSDWQSVAQILKDGVEMSTLPCVKLHAIVEAAREISLLHEREHGQDVILGADDFLPIFIFSVVRADMERPCALCVLLKTLCDKSNWIGEIGYFLASFEAAITHIQEIDLSEDRDSMLSFASTPLTDISLG